MSDYKASCTHFFAEVIQFLRPNGKQWVDITRHRSLKKTECPLPIALEDLYNEMHEHGCRFEIELLQTNEVSTTITRLDTPEREGEDIDIRITVNGPSVQAGMREMLERRPWKRGDNERSSGEDIVRSEEDAGDGQEPEDAGDNEER
jgi:hypothetical protein